MGPGPICRSLASEQSAASVDTRGHSSGLRGHEHLLYMVRDRMKKDSFQQGDQSSKDTEWASPDEGRLLSCLSVTVMKY